MYAIVHTCGKQYRVTPGEKIQVDRLPGDEGAEFILDRVLMIGGDDTRLGDPIISGATVTARIVSHELGEKRQTVKYRRRHRTRRSVGYRPAHTTLEILAING